MQSTITSFIGDKPVAQREVQQWEARRARAVLEKFIPLGRLATPANPDYPIQIAGQALLDDGFVIGGVRHQLRDRDDALEALLTVEFPGVAPAALVAAHRWHLAVEFGNWIVASQSDPTAKG